MNTENQLGHKIGNIQIVDIIDDPSTVRIYQTIKGVFKIRYAIKKYKIDVMHILYAEPNALWLFWKFFFRVPIILTTRGSDILRTIPAFFSKNGLLNFLVAKQYRFSLNNADHITCTSKSQIESVKSIITEVKDISLIQTGVDFTLMDQANIDMVASLNLPQKIILMPRAIKPVYNHEFTLEAIEKCKSVVRENYCFVFLASQNLDKDYYVLLKKKAKKIDADIRFCTGLPYTKVLSLYKQVSLVIMNPFSDGTPASGLEVLGCGIPLIFGPLNYDSELMVDLCFKLTSWDTSELAEVIEKILNMDPALKIERGNNSREKIRERASFQTNMNKLKDTYYKLKNEVRQ